MTDIPLIACKNLLCARVASADQLFCCRDCRTSQGRNWHTKECTANAKARAEAMEAALGYRKTVKPPRESKLKGVVDAYREENNP